jgi:Crp-like helix-turn-helix domain
VESRTAAPARLGLFGDELLTAAHRWPRLVQGLYACIGEQLQRLTAQLVICQLPRVDDRILAMFWLLSESWGQVTPSGIRLPLALTHEALGALVGAARPTVTLALRKLTEQGAIIHQDTGWLLLGASPEATESSAHSLAPEPQQVGVEPWALAPAQPDPSIAYTDLRDSLQRLRAQHRLDREEVRERLNSVIRQRVRMAAVRDRVTEDAIRRDWPPQSA